MTRSKLLFVNAAIAAALTTATVYGGPRAAVAAAPPTTSPDPGTRAGTFVFVGACAFIAVGALILILVTRRRRTASGRTKPSADPTTETASAARP